MITHACVAKFLNEIQPKREKFSGLSRREKRRKMANEEDAGETVAIRAAVRSAKKAGRPAKIGEPERRPALSKKKEKKAKAKQRIATRGFDKDLGQRTAREGVRAKKTDSVGSGKKSGGKRRKTK